MYCKSSASFAIQPMLDVGPGTAHCRFLYSPDLENKTHTHATIKTTMKEVDLVQKNKLVYTYYKLPVTYLNLNYEDTRISLARAKQLQGKISQAPKTGLLVIKGTAAPVINQLVDEGREVRGIDFTERANAAFEQHDNPQADVVLIHSVGAEVTTNYNISRQILHALITHYKKEETLLIIETDFTKSELRNHYDLTPTNFLSLELKDQPTFI